MTEENIFPPDTIIPSEQKFICEIHGETTHYIQVTLDGRNDYYCMKCYAENVIEKFCKPLTKKETEK